MALVGCGRIGFDLPRINDMPLDVGSGAADVAADVTIASCTPGAALPPTRVINASLSDPSDACQLNNALVADGLGAGLDRLATAQCPGTWDSSGSCGCLALDLGAAYVLSKIDVVARPVSVGCSYSCVSGSCGSGDTFSVLTGVYEGSYAWLSNVPMTGTQYAQYSVTKPVVARFVTVCRQAYDAIRDDVAVDAVTAYCQ